MALTTEEIIEHQRHVDNARNICRSVRIKCLWSWVLYGATASATVEGYTLSIDPRQPSELVSLTIPTSGKNLVDALKVANVWTPDVVAFIVTSVTTSDLWLLPCANKDLTWTQAGNTKMSSIVIGNYEAGEILVNLV